jgi:hypothetical protein
MVGCLKDDELARMWKKAVVIYFKVPSCIPSEELRKTAMNLSLDSSFPGPRFEPSAS